MGCWWRSGKNGNLIWFNVIKFLFDLFDFIKIQDFPQNLAYPLGGSEDEFKYFFLELHYDNPDKLRK